MTIAKGAALATATMTTVGEFTDRGAAFGLQLRQKAPRSKKDDSKIWDDYALLLLDKVRLAFPSSFLFIMLTEPCGQNHQNHVDNLFFQGGDEVKIICDPFRRAERDSDVLQFFRCYDVTPTWTPTRGHWSFDLSLDKQEEDFYLVLKASKKARRRQKKRRRTAYEWKLPVYFDGGTNCVLIGGRNMELADLGPGMPWTPEADDNQEETIDTYRSSQNGGRSEVGRSSKV